MTLAPSVVLRSRIVQDLIFIGIAAAFAVSSWLLVVLADWLMKSER
jgi:hypothetical protein